LTSAPRQASIGIVSETTENLTASTERLAALARLLADAAATRLTPPMHLSFVRQARDVDAQAEQVLKLTVQLARESGHTWQEVGDLLGVSRQAAFQRFGKPIDPRTGEPMDKTLRIPDAAERATTLLTDLLAQRYDAVFATFDEQVAAGLPVEKMPDVLASIASMVGEFERVGDSDAFVRQLGEHTVADVPLSFEAGDMKGRVAFNEDGTVAGLFILPPTAP
jgi:hypothetical protein